MDTILVILPKSKFGNVENVKVCGNRRLPEENEVSKKTCNVSKQFFRKSSKIFVKF